MPRKLPRRHCQRGGRPSFSAAVGIFSAYMFTSAGKTIWAAPPKWHFDQIFRPQRVLSSCVATFAGELTMATPQTRRLLFLDARALVLRRLLGEFHRSKTQRRRCRRNASLNFFAKVTFVLPRGGFWRGNNKDDSAETATSFKYVVLGHYPSTPPIFGDPLQGH